MEWINVNDSLPNGECLAINDHLEMLVGHVHRDGNGNCVCESDSEYLLHVTHWAQPKPPEK